MRLAGKLGMSALALVAITGAVVAINTARFDPGGIASGDDIKPISVPAFNNDLAAQHISQAVRFQTISHQNAAENDWTQWDHFHSWLQTTYPQSHKMMQRQLVADQTLIYSWPGSDASLQPIILMAHQDVVPVTAGTEKDWKHAPFSGDIAEGSIWGRGSVDDKGSLIALFEALENLTKSGFKPKRTIYLVSGHDEEAGGSGAAAAAQSLATIAHKALFVIDEGSATIMDAPVIKNKAILIGIAEKGYGTIKITANSAGGHSSMPPKETGVVNLAKAIIAINEKPFPYVIDGPAAKLLGGLAAAKGGFVKMAMANRWLFGPSIKGNVAKTPSGAALLHTTIAPTMLEGSPKENVLPQSANALINYRISPGTLSADVMARAKSAVGNLPVILTWVKPPKEASKVSSTDSLGWKYIAAVAKSDDTGAALAPNLVVAGTDSRSFQDISDDVYRYMPYHFYMKDTAMIHGTNEHLTLDNLKRSIKFYERLIATAAG